MVSGPTTSRQIVHLRGWPGVDGWKPPPLDVARPRLGRHQALVLFAAGDAEAPDDRFGLGGFLIVRGGFVFDAGFVVPDDLGDRDPAALANLERCAAARTFDALDGRRSWGVTTLSAFTDPLATIEHSPSTFTAAGYVRRGSLVVGVDLGRTLGLMADPALTVERTGKNTGSWELWLPGWGVRQAEGNVTKVSPHRPPLWVKHRRQGWQVTFGRCERGNGEPGPHDFLDVLSLAYALDADRGGGFVDHAAAFGVAAEPLPLVVSIDPGGAESVARTVEALHVLVVALDAEAGRWFTSPVERAEGTSRLHIARAQSPSAIAALVPTRFGVRPALLKFRLPDEEQARWAETFAGGWCSDVAGLRGVPFTAALADVTSAFPLTAHLVGWWALYTASTIRHEVVTDALRRACERAVADPATALDPKLWRRLGVTLVEVVPDGEPFPIEVEDDTRPDGRSEVVPVFSPARSMFYAWPDVLGAATMGRRVPRIVRAIRLVPGPPEPGLRERVPVVPGLVLDVDEDPVLGLVRRRRDAKVAGDTRLAKVLHASVNTLVSGDLSRFDERLVKRGRVSKLGEVPGPRTFLPIACTVQAGARLLLAVVDRMVVDRGGIVAYRDTDSSFIPASPNGGTLTLADGSTVRELSFAEVAAITDAFAPLSPDTGTWPVWKVECGTETEPLRVVTFGPKRHAQYVTGVDKAAKGDDEDGGGTGAWLDDSTSAGLGGMWAAPPAMSERGAYSRAAVAREVALCVARVDDPGATRPPAPWDAAGAPPFPTMRRLSVVSPEVLRSLPDALGARPGSRYLVGVTDRSGLGLAGEVVALDPGGDLSGWQSLRWLDRRTGVQTPVGTGWDVDSFTTARLESLDVRAARYGAAPRTLPLDAVHVDPLLVRHLGRVSGGIDAQLDGLPGDIRARRTVYGDADRVAAAQKLAGALGPYRFARRTRLPLRVAKRAAAGESISKRNAARAIRALRIDDGTAPLCGCGCGLPVLRRQGALYVDDAHRKRAERARQRASDLSTTHPARKGHDRKKAVP